VRIRRLFLLGTLAAAPLVPFLLIGGADKMLALRTHIGRADAIVVLGGDGPRRAARAASLYADGIAPFVLVSGEGDCRYIEDLLVADGVPPSAITVECVSRTTWENALRAKPILELHGVRRAVLVTSWFHTLRAFYCFTLLAPAIHWMTAPAERDMPLSRLLQGVEGRQIVKEYFKIAWYAPRHWAGAALAAWKDKWAGR